MALVVFVALLPFGCTAPGPVAFRHSDFRPAEIRRPVLLLQVSLDRTDLLGEGEFSSQERSSIPEAFEVALLESFNAEGILPLDVSVSSRRSASPGSTEGIDAKPALERGRAVGADLVMILEARLSRQDFVFCREERRPFVARTTSWTLAARVLRVADGSTLLIEPAGPGSRASDVEPDCERGRIARRLSAQELLDVAARRGLSLLLAK